MSIDYDAKKNWASATYGVAVEDNYKGVIEHEIGLKKTYE
jgi:hypothetical protein